MNHNHRRLRKGSEKTFSVHLPTLLLCLLSSFIGFYVGLVVGSGVRSPPLSESVIHERIDAEVMKRMKLFYKSRKSKNEDTDPRFPSSIGKIVTGASVVNRDDFARTFDSGVPLDASSRENNEVLILYNNRKALPSDPSIAAEAQSMVTAPLLPVQAATENCDHLHVVLTQPSSTRQQCIALFGQYESFHLQKWVRLPEKGQTNNSFPLRLVPRGAQDVGRVSHPPPTSDDTHEYWQILRKYIETIDSALERLKPIATKVAVRNTVIVLICNEGQSELLANFVCSARSRGFDLSSVLVFATDTETKDLAEAFGLTVFYEEDIFGEIPKKAARQYGDRVFARIMMGKVFCVHMVNMLGYDVLFQDVDVIWYKNPLEFFHNESSSVGGFDAYFQDDGNRGLYYAPYSANTGFYYIRNNERTRYFFNALLTSGDLILRSRSHQIALVALLQEHSSMYGLKIKILSRDEDEFPGGYTFHNRKSYMRSMIAGEVSPYIFHMSWTANHIDKRRFYEQMNEWFLEDSCVSKSAQQLVKIAGGSENVVDDCCSSEALFKCHYRDKPSKYPCKKSPPIDKGGRSFW